MSSASKPSVPVKAPDKGSFPIDHFRECEEEAETYRMCLNGAKNFPKKCRREAQVYLECRMDRGLMAKQSSEELGFTQEASWEFERSSREDIAQTISGIMQESRKRVWLEHLKKTKG
jgi:cytochrome c oxidase assembly protein subunit 19